MRPRSKSRSFSYIDSKIRHLWGRHCQRVSMGSWHNPTYDRRWFFVEPQPILNSICKNADKCLGYGDYGFFSGEIFSCGYKSLIILAFIGIVSYLALYIVNNPFSWDTRDAVNSIAGGSHPFIERVLTFLLYWFVPFWYFLKTAFTFPMSSEPTSYIHALKNPHFSG